MKNVVWNGQKSHVKGGEHVLDSSVPEVRLRSDKGLLDGLGMPSEFQRGLATWRENSKGQGGAIHTRKCVPSPGWVPQSIAFMAVVIRPILKSKATTLVSLPCLISHSQATIRDVHSSGDEDYRFSALETDFVWLGVVPLAGIFIVAVLACARYTAKPCTYHDSVPTILPHACTPAQLETRSTNSSLMGDTFAALKNRRKSVGHYTWPGANLLGIVHQRQPRRIGGRQRTVAHIPV
jgi:hypothetical protein